MYRDNMYRDNALNDINSNSSKSEYKKESISTQFLRSCLGKIIVLAIILIVLLTTARLTVPNESKMIWGTLDGVYQCIVESHGVAGDMSDDFVRNAIATFSHEADSLKKDSVLLDFNKLNKVEVHDHIFFSTSHIINNFNSNGKRAAIGICGMVIPIVNFNDFILRSGPVRKDYNQKLINAPTQPISSDSYMGETPALDNTESDNETDSQ